MLRLTCCDTALVSPHLTCTKSPRSSCHCTQMARAALEGWSGAVPSSKSHSGRVRARLTEPAGLCAVPPAAPSLPRSPGRGAGTWAGCLRSPGRSWTGPSPAPRKEPQQGRSGRQGGPDSALPAGITTRQRWALRRSSHQVRGAWSQRSQPPLSTPLRAPSFGCNGISGKRAACFSILRLSIQLPGLSALPAPCPLPQLTTCSLSLPPPSWPSHL